MMKARLLFWAVIIAGTVLDIGTKTAVFNYCENRPVDVIPHFFSIRCSKNWGGVWGIGQGKGRIFTIFSFVVIIVIFWVFFSAPKPSMLVSVALGLVLSGAIGNLYDRLILGYVRDFVDLHVSGKYWPTFNIADASICIGIAILTVRILKEERTTLIGAERDITKKAKD